LPRSSATCTPTTTSASAFGGAAPTDGLEISEECVGFPEVAAEMRRRFPTIDEAWYADVMQPPFATNYTLLYGTIDNSHPA